MVVQNKKSFDIIITVPGFRLYTKADFKKSSGGVAALISDTIDISVEELDVNQQDTLWLKIKNQIKTTVI